MPIRMSTGSDPEYFLVERGTKKLYTGGFKGSRPIHPRRYLYRTKADNIMVEFNPQPINLGLRTPSMLIRNTLARLRGAPTLVGGPNVGLFDLRWFPPVTGSEIMISPEPACVVHIPEKELQKAHLQSPLMEMGCLPDMDAYTGKPYPPYAPGDLGEYRYAGGHMHFSVGDCETPRHHEWARCIRNLDALIGPALAALFPGKQGRRIDTYGRPGRFRMPRHGLEWRTPANLWGYMSNEYIQNLFVASNVIVRQTLLQNLDYSTHPVVLLAMYRLLNAPGKSKEDRRQMLKEHMPAITAPYGSASALKFLYTSNEVINHAI